MNTFFYRYDKQKALKPNVACFVLKKFSLRDDKDYMFEAHLRLRYASQTDPRRIRFP